MEVQVTRDLFGVSVWRADVELVYDAPFKSVVNHVWYPKKTFIWKPRVFSDKFVKKNFPELYDLLEEGDRRDMDLKLI